MLEPAGGPLGRVSRRPLARSAGRAYAGQVGWPEVFIVFLVTHLLGDFALQTDWQARHKHGGLGPGRQDARRALLRHVTSYTLAFVPALVWMASENGGAVAAVAAVLIFLPHLVQDDGRLIDGWVRTVKGAGAVGEGGVMVGVDQAFHALTLLATALLVSTL